MKKYYHFFGGFLESQENWLNKMVSSGNRLVDSTKLSYTFAPCAPGEYQYRIEFIGQMSQEKAEEYRLFLEEMGYRVFYKNINLNYSVGKVRWRPWADKGGRIATNSTTFNRELFIVEKKNDGKPFLLHTTYIDTIAYYTTLRKIYLTYFLLFAALGIVLRTWVAGIFALLFLIPLGLYQLRIRSLQMQAHTEES